MSTLKVDDVAAYLRMTETDDNLQTVLDSAEAHIEQWVGPLRPTTVTSRIRGRGTLCLPVTPVISLVSITGDDASIGIGVTDLDVDPDSGVLSSYGQTCRSWPSRHYSVTYLAGREELPADLRLAVLELTRHLWQVQRGPTASRNQTTAPPAAGSTYTLPNRVLELLYPFTLPSFA